MVLPDFSIALPEIFLACVAMALLMVGAFRGNKSTSLISWLSVLAFISVQDGAEWENAKALSEGVQVEADSARTQADTNGGRRRRMRPHCRQEHRSSGEAMWRATIQVQTPDTRQTRVTHRSRHGSAPR